MKGKNQKYDFSKADEDLSKYKDKAEVDENIENSVVDDEIKNLSSQAILEQKLYDKTNDRKLKTSLMRFVIIIASVMILFCWIVFGIDIHCFFTKGHHLYSEWFLLSLLGSQAVIMPLLLLKIISLHLFPNKTKK